MDETLVRYLQFLPSDVLPNCHLIAPEPVLVVVGEAVTRIGVSIDIVDIARYLDIYLMFCRARMLQSLFLSHMRILSTRSHVFARVSTCTHL